MMRRERWQGRDCARDEVLQRVMPRRVGYWLIHGDPRGTEWIGGRGVGHRSAFRPTVTAIMPRTRRIAARSASARPLPVAGSCVLEATVTGGRGVTLPPVVVDGLDGGDDAGAVVGEVVGAVTA